MKRADFWLKPLARRCELSDTTRDLSALERYRPLVDDWDAFCEALSRPLPQCVWGNSARITPDALLEWLERCGLGEALPLSWCEGAWRIPASPRRDLGTLLPFLAGLYHIQEEASLLPGHWLAPQPHERVLDTCAAPGGKSAQLAIQMRNTGSVIANDRDAGRLRALRSIIDRLGLVNVSMTRFDAANMPREVGLFDRILVDVPCSCEGTSRKNVSVLEHVKRFDHDAHSRLQEAILTRALEQLRPGGLLAYSTCTYAPEENERVVSRSLARFGEGRAQVEALPALRGFYVSPGLTEFGGERFGEAMARCGRVWPHHNDTGGFFVALIRRSSEGDVGETR